jgi:hypothetical protein
VMWWLFVKVIVFNSLISGDGSVSSVHVQLAGAQPFRCTASLGGSNVTSL